MAKFPLYPYQERAVEKFTTLPRGGLFDDVGLGKTVQALEIANELGSIRVLIVVKARLHYQWENAVSDHMPDMDKRIVHRVKTSKKHPLPPLDYDGVVIMGHHDLIQNKDWVIQWAPELILADECHHMKNRKTKLFKAFCSVTDKLAKARVLLMSATPGTKDLTDLWTYFRIFDKKRFGSYWGFVNKYFHTEVVTYGGVPIREIGLPKNPEEFKALLREYCLRRVRPGQSAALFDEEVGEVGRVVFLPILIDFSARESLAYNRMKKEFFLELTDHNKVIDAMTKLTLAGKLRQLTWGEDYFADPPTFSHSSKAKAVVEIADSVDGKVLVGCSYRASTTLVVQALERAGYSVATFVGGDRNYQEEIDRFVQDPNVKALVVTIKAAGEGLDGLQHVCNTVIFADIESTPAPNLQFLGRVDRIGQENLVLCYSIHVNKTGDKRIRDIVQARNTLFIDTLPLEVAEYYLEGE